jgi:hypothetical protein
MNHKPVRPTVGPRGGRAVQATPCSECVSWRSCRPGAISEPFGCESWADQDGRRALPDQLEPEPEGGAAEYERDRIEAEADVARLCGLSANPQPHADASVRWDLEPEDAPEPEPFRPSEAYRPDQLRGEGPAQGALAMADAGPLFAGCPEVRR